jgi:tRNA (guanine-N7-)-methyltransferase
MSDYIDPAQFIITRKRKKYKFAKFANASNCFEYDQWQPRHVDVLEIGAGTGFFSTELARRHPEQIFVAIDVKADRLQKGAHLALEEGIENIYFIRARADQIEELFTPDSLSAIWLTFPDPYPKKRAAGRRLTHPTFLRRYATLLGNTGRLNLKHDNPAFFEWSLEQLVAEKWYLQALTFDLHDTDFDDDFKILTSYEQRWLKEGLHTKFASARRGV